jgi:hypothetical protein
MAFGGVSPWTTEEGFRGLATKEGFRGLATEEGF